MPTCHGITYSVESAGTVWGASKDFCSYLPVPSYVHFLLRLCSRYRLNDSDRSVPSEIVAVGRAGCMRIYICAFRGVYGFSLVYQLTAHHISTASGGIHPVVPSCFALFNMPSCPPLFNPFATPRKNFIYILKFQVFCNPKRVSSCKGAP